MRIMSLPFHNKSWFNHVIYVKISFIKTGRTPVMDDDPSTPAMDNIDPKLRVHPKRLVTKFPDDSFDILALSNNCLVISNNCSLRCILAKDFIDYSKSIEKPLTSVKYVNLNDAVQKFRHIFRDSVDRVANFTRNILAKQSKNNATYGFALLRDTGTALGASRALFHYYVPLHEIIASLKNPRNNSHLQDIITNWDQHIRVVESCSVSANSVISGPLPPSKQVGCRKPGESIGFLPARGKDRLYLARCYLYGSAVAMAPGHVAHPISWFRKNVPNFLNYLKLSICAELDLPTTTQWVDNSITREIEAKVLPKVKMPPLLNSSNAMSHDAWRQHLAQLRRDNIMAIHILPPCPSSVTDDINDAHIQSTEEVRALVWSVLRGVQCCCSSGLVFPSYRLKAYCSLTPSPFTAHCIEHIAQNLSYQPPHDLDNDVAASTAYATTATAPTDFPVMKRTLPHSTLTSPPHPSICVMLPRHDAMWRFDFPSSFGAEEGGHFSGVKLQLYAFLHKIIFTSLNVSNIHNNTILCPSPLPPASLPVPTPPPQPAKEASRASKKRRSDMSLTLKLGFEVAFRRNFEDAPQPTPAPTANATANATTTVPAEMPVPTAPSAQVNTTLPGTGDSSVHITNSSAAVAEASREQVEGGAGGIVGEKRKTPSSSTATSTTISEVIS